MDNRKKIYTFEDLNVYKKLFSLMIRIHKDLLPLLPKNEKYGLVDQIKRCSKAGPAILAEGFSHRYQEQNWKKYLNDVLGECNEMIHHLSVCIHVFEKEISVTLVSELLEEYKIVCRQLTVLKKVWKNYHTASKK